MKDALYLERILDKLKIMDRRMDSLEKNVSFISTEREILEDIRTSFVALKELMLNQRDHHDNKMDDIKAEIQLSAIKTEDKLDDAKEKLEEVKDIIKQ